MDAAPRNLGVGLIGCGRIAQRVHLPVLAGLPNVELVALAEPDPERQATAAARAPAAVAFADYRELLATSSVEAVVVCLPSGLHAEAAVAAFEAGKHLYLEKPLATTLADGDRVLAAWRRAGTIGMIGFNFRVNRLYQEMRQRLRAGEIGDLVGARSVFSTVTRPLPDWKLSRQSGGGALLDLASHHIDLVRFLFDDEVHRVFANLRSHRAEDDTAMLELQLGGGLLVQSFFSYSSVEDDRFEVYGQRGRLALDKYLSTTVEFVDASWRGARLKRMLHGLRSARHALYLVEKRRAPNHDPSWSLALRRFVAAAHANRPDLATPDLLDGYRSLAVVLAAEDAARSGQAVTLPPPTDTAAASGTGQDA